MKKILVLIVVSVLLLTACDAVKVQEEPVVEPVAAQDLALAELVNQVVATVMAMTPHPTTAEPQPQMVTPVDTATTTPTLMATVEQVVNTPVPQVLSGASDILEVARADNTLDYPALTAPDASKWFFPNKLVRYEAPFEDGDYFETGHGDIDLPQYYFRVMTAGEIEIPQLGISCIATSEKGCAAILINHFGETVMFRNTVVDNGFTVAGLVFDMSTPEKVTEAAQALIDHYVYRMTVNPNDGANCSVVTGCASVEWHVVVVGNGETQVHWTGLFRR